MPSPYRQTYGRVSVTTATVTVAADGYLGVPIVLDRAAGIAVTLPASSGSGNQYEFIVATTFTGEATIKVANGTDVMQGTATLYADGGDTVLGFATAASSDTITLTATNTTGGIAGCRILLTDIKSGFWNVQMVSDAAGTEATPFSATVT
jgi:hypothetical protein